MDRQVPSLSFPLLLFVHPGAPLPGVAIPGSCLFSSHCSLLCPPFGRFDLAPPLAPPRCPSDRKAELAVGKSSEDGEGPSPRCVAGVGDWGVVIAAS